MAAGNAIIARDNLYNRWVAGEGALYFQTSSEVDQLVSSLLENPALRDSLGSSAKSRYDAEFTWERIVGQYEELLQRYLPASR
jgi:glycosyltransferase involved in cell wall biosynthesis